MFKRILIVVDQRQVSRVAIKQGVAIAAAHGAEALFLTNCRAGVWPVAELQPGGQQFNTVHPLLAELARALAEDRSAYAKTHRTAWNIA